MTNDQGQRASQNSAEIFGSFFLGANEFALRVQDIQEVVNPPEKYTAMPLAPEYSLGIFNLRGQIVPVVNLRKLLRLEAELEIADSAKIAIVDFGGAKIGLVFDRTGEIFRCSDDQRSKLDYAVSNSGRKNVISEVIKRQEGRRIIQVLNPSALVSLENILQTSTLDSDLASPRKNRVLQGMRKQCISFRVGPAQCAFAIAGIGEIIKFQELKPSALAVGPCLGMITLRGGVVPIVDFAILLGYGSTPATSDGTQKQANKHDEPSVDDERRIVVMNLGGEKVGLLVSSVQNIISFREEDLLSVPIIGKERAKMFVGCLSRAGLDDVMLLDHTQVLSSSEIAEITHGHSKIYQASAKGLGSAKGRGPRKTFITFRLGSLFAVGIEELGEIIEYPKNLMRPPGMPGYVDGMLNLRGQVLPIVDARALYSMSRGEQAQSRRVLVLSRQGLRFGLVVDTVENIITISDDEHLSLPKGLGGHQEGGSKIASMSADMKAAVEVQIQDSTQNGTKTTLIILDLEPLTERVRGVAKSA